MIKWIKVEEQLPEESEFGVSKELLIWAYNPKGNFQFEIGYYCPSKKRWYFPDAITKMTPTDWAVLEPPSHQEHHVQRKLGLLR